MVSHKVSITLVLFFCINLISTNIYASNVGGWSISNPVAKGASTVYTGIKNITLNGADYVKKGTAIVTPTATSVAKVLARGAGGFALSIAVEQLLGAVDWVLDPANNQIVYYEEPTDASNLQWAWVTPINGKQTAFATASSACQARLASEGFTYVSTSNPIGNWATCNGKQSNGFPVTVQVNYTVNPTYNPNAEREKKTLPLETVAQKIISNAESGDATAQEATTAAADIVAEAEKDSAKARPIVNQLESNSSTSTSETATGESTTKDPTTGSPTKTDISLNFPVFCNWAPVVCEAANTVISFPTTLDEWWETSNKKADGWANSISSAWTSVKNWMKEEPSKDDQVEIQEKEPEQKTVDLNFGSACPAPVVLIDSTFYDQPFKIEYSFNDFCSILSDFVRPVLIAMGAFIAALILGGVKTNE